MRKIAALFFIALLLTGCGMIGALVNGMRYARAVEADLEGSTGTRPQVGFNWSNGKLVTVTVTFPRIDEKRPLSSLAQDVRRAVAGHFPQTAENVVLAFALGKSTAEIAER